MKKQLFLLSSVLLLTACDTNRTEETPADSPDETDIPTTEVEEVETEPETDSQETDAETDTDKQDPSDKEITETAAASHLLADFIHETTFMDAYALQAWEDYQAVAADASYGDITLIQNEDPDISQLDGSSFSEIEEGFNALDLREDVYREQAEVSDTETLYFYRYPAEETSEYSEISDFLVELSYYFIDDNLVFSSITPGLYQVELNDLPDAQTLTTFTTVPEIASVNPQVFTIAEMEVNDHLIQQTMIPATYINDEGVEEMMAFYFFTHGEDILHYAFLPFEMVSQSFPDHSILLYQEIIPELIKMDLDETL